MNDEPVIRLRRFDPTDQEDAKALILAGLADHWGELDPTLNPDLNNIAESYENAIFIVASQNDRIVGTGALVPRSAAKAVIMRMSVASDLRRAGIGTQILDRLCEESKIAGFKQLMLETTATWDEVIAFYQRYGFHITHYKESEFGRDVYFALDLR